MIERICCVIPGCVLCSRAFFPNWIVTFTFALAGGPGTTNSLEVNADFTAVFQLVNADSILSSRQY